MEPGHSDKCTDRKTYLDLSSGKCTPCPIKKGKQAVRNCGFDDIGSRHEFGYTPCPDKTFNDGSSADCRSCTVCRPGHKVLRSCSSTQNTQCEIHGTQTTEAPLTTSKVTILKNCTGSGTKYDKDTGKCVPRHTPSGGAGERDYGFNGSTLPNIPLSTSQGSTSTPQSTAQTTNSSSDPLWAVPIAVFVSFLVVLCVLVILKKLKRGQRVFKCCKRSLNAEKGFIPLFTTDGNKDPKEVLSPVILSAPLQSVLDNLDVLEELVILLDPESHGVKNTKHLASHCAFTSTWVTYTYSMKDSKSPLKAVLEGVTSKHPDWTVEHLAKLLILIERNDAVAVLAKLRLYSAAEFEGCTHM